ncbi:hypothetical protein [Nitratireductor sp. XY-223]|uniref:hypothetical protein n=1 Tax=Nitratireductor sp. XY-223 TaxID=2561926 RepID=UPI0010AA1CA7|nr:hypothetical protein [Nitratireductor sp. XY-223]
MTGLIAKAGGALLGWLTGGTLDRILDSVDHKVDNATERERIKAAIIKTHMQAQANLLVSRTWWFQLFFVIPLGIWFSAVVADSLFHFTWNVAALPAPLDQWAGWIVSSLFLVDGGKVLIGRILK